MSIRRACVVLAGLGASLAACSGPGTDRPVGVRVHAFQNEANGLVNQFLVETPSSVVAVDGGFLESDVAAMEAELAEIGKPLVGILVTHAHLDHTNGLARLSRRGAVPVYAASRTVREHEAHDYRTRLPHLTALYPEGEPSFTEVRDGFEIERDDVRFRLVEMGPGESEWDAVWVVEAGEDVHAFVGDIVLHQVHAFFQAGRSREWLGSLAELRRILPDRAVVHPGHGPSPAGIEALDWQADYIRRARALIGRTAAGADSLSAVQEREVFAEMAGWLPENRLEFLILLGADVLASELALEAERARVDEKLAALAG